MNTLPNAQARQHYLDCARVFALLLGVVFHASLSFMPVFIGWAVMDISTSDLVLWFVMVAHSFRMELFYLIAGYFSYQAFGSKGAANFLKSRLFRLGLPFTFGWLLLKPLVNSGWIMGAESMAGDVDVAGGLVKGFTTMLVSPGGVFVGTHLWFLYYLLMFTGLLVVSSHLIQRHFSKKPLVFRRVDSMVNGLCASRFGMVILSFPVAVCLWFMPNWAVDTPDKSLVPNLPVFILYLVFFVFGWLLKRNQHSLDWFAEIDAWRLVLCVLSIVACIELAAYESSKAHDYYTFLKAGFLLSYGIMMWSLVGLTLGVCKRWFNRSNSVICYLSKASYWIYLIHLPLVLWLQVAFVELSMHWLLKLICIVCLTLLSSIVLYEAFVRRTLIGRILSGNGGPSEVSKSAMNKASAI